MDRISDKFVIIAITDDFLVPSVELCLAGSAAGSLEEKRSFRWQITANSDGASLTLKA